MSMCVKITRSTSNPNINNSSFTISATSTLASMPTQKMQHTICVRVVVGRTQDKHLGALARAEMLLVTFPAWSLYKNMFFLKRFNVAASALIIAFQRSARTTSAGSNPRAHIIS